MNNGFIITTDELNKYVEITVDGKTYKMDSEGAADLMTDIAAAIKMWIFLMNQPLSSVHWLTMMVT